MVHGVKFSLETSFFSLERRAFHIHSTKRPITTHCRMSCLFVLLSAFALTECMQYVDILTQIDPINDMENWNQSFVSFSNDVPFEKVILPVGDLGFCPVCSFLSVFMIKLSMQYGLVQMDIFR